VPASLAKRPELHEFLDAFEVRFRRQIRPTRARNQASQQHVDDVTNWRVGRPSPSRGHL
jgi:hypothetical protein